MKNQSGNKFEIYKTADGQTQIEVKFTTDTVWLNQYQLAHLFDTDRTSISKHIKKIFETGELEENSTCAKIAQVQKEGQREIRREVLHYNLDVIISVGYRVNSVLGTQFRIWATNRLKEYLTEGYIINEKRLAQKNQEIKVLKDGISILNRVIAKEIENAENNSEWLNLFSKGLKLLDDYDNETLDLKGETVIDTVFPDYKEYIEMINKMNSEFKSDVFAKPKDESFNSSINQIKQSFSGNELYPSIEEKAANLLYFIVKNHSFVDGNKRIAAACFLLFLEKNNMLQKNNKTIISNETLASLTLYIANSKAEESETVKRLIISLLNRSKM